VTRRVVELAGLAGAGKTTLATALAATGAATLGVEASRMRTVAGVAGAAPALVTARARSGGRLLTRSELRSVAYLGAWRTPVSRFSDGDLLLDHGPVYRLASLLVTGPPLVHTPTFERWWRRTGEEWAGRLDLVVWLDTTDDLLRQRIDDRLRRHRLQGASRPQAQEFLDRYRRAYARTLDLVGREGTQVVRVDSGAPLAELTDSVRGILAGTGDGGVR
jgi:adenylate kinase family enzyme